MTYRDLPYYEGIKAKTRRKYILHKSKHKNHANSLHTVPLENGTELGPSLPYLVVQSIG